MLTSMLKAHLTGFCVSLSKLLPVSIRRNLHLKLISDSFKTFLFSPDALCDLQSIDNAVNSSFRSVLWVIRFVRFPCAVFY